MLQEPQGRRERRIFKAGTTRMLVVYLFLFGCAAFLFSRLWWIQVLHPERLIAEGNARVMRSYQFEPPRGLITDRFGKILAISVPVKTVDADPKLLRDSGVYQDEARMQKIASLLGIGFTELKDKLSDPDRRFVHLKRYFSEKDAPALKAAGGEGLLLHDSYMRTYPTGAENAPLVGILNSEGVGVYGIEQSFNRYLTSSASSRMANKDRYDRIIENLKVVRSGYAGGNLMLSIDGRLQSYAYERLSEALKENDADSATLVLTDVRTGEILSMVSCPSFDPNNRSSFDSANARDRAVTDIFEPGSTIKPIVALAALENRTAGWSIVYDTRPFKVDGKLVRDSHAMESGTLSDIIKYSSNTGMAHISLETGPKKSVEMLRRFGFGSRTESGIIGENDGRLNDQRRFWSDIDIATLGFGYGIAVTNLQLASAYATLASGGARRPVSILRLSKPPKATQAANATEVARMQKALETVVAEGTGGKAAISRYRVGGKTGTAKIAVAGGYGNSYIGTFAGFAPLSDPRFALVVVMKNPKAGKFYGGLVSGPVFRDVMSRALQLYNVPPDRTLDEKN
ncbi:MAG: penicillin-binding transpeptidase domain-containing protein [Succinivibrio sp.]|jgi:cell division protein FtsI (penicillin-binding protein 3)|nr:penicillin-binding transpeptidase domain-containing protein [Succinivibrio sp.]